MRSQNGAVLVTQGAIRLAFEALAAEFPLSKLSSIACIHNGQGLTSENRESHGTIEVFASGGFVGMHTEAMHSGPFVVIGRKGSAGKLTFAPRGGWVTDTAYFATPLRASELDCKYLFYALRSLDFTDDVIATAIPGINRTAIYAHVIPLPPLDTQTSLAAFLDATIDNPVGTELPLLPSPVSNIRAVVARIRSMATDIQEAIRLRRSANEETEALWTAILRDAFSSCDGPVVQLERVCKAIVDNLHSNPRYADTGVPCVRSPDVGWGTLHLETALRTDEDEYQRRTVRGEPEPDDIVLVREGGGTGKAALVEQGHRFSLGQRVMMLRPDQARVLPRFFLYQLLSPLIQDDHIVPLSKGSASPHLNIGALKQFPFRAPPLQVQAQIVARLDQLREEVDRLSAYQLETAVEIEALLPSVLSKAFAGEL